MTENGGGSGEGRAASSPGRLANLVLATAALSCAGILFLALGELHGGLTPEQLLFFYALPALALVGIAGTFLLSTASRLKVALVLVSLGMGLVAAETFVGLAFRLRSARLGAGESPGDSSMLDVVLAKRAAGDHAYPRVPGNVLVNESPEFRSGALTLHAVSPGPGNASTVLCNQGGPAVAYRSDRLGFNNPREAWTEQLEVLLIGDSYTHGACVKDQHQLATRLRGGRRVLNLGMSGAGPLMELAILREYGASLTPPLVVWIYYEGNDLWDLNQASRREWLTAYLDASHTQDLLGHRHVVDAEYRSWVDSLVAAEDLSAGAEGLPAPLPGLPSDIVRFASLRRLTRFAVLFPSKEPPLGLLPRIIERARDDVAAWGGRLVLVYMPAYERYDTWIGDGIAGRRELIELAEALGIPLIDLDPAFVATGDPRSLWTSPAGHLGPEGYRVAAEVIAAALDSISPSRPPDV